jgi:TrmH family RNA methyltransferase
MVAAGGSVGSVDPWNPNAVRASLGTVFTLALAVATTADVLEWLRDRGIRIVAARVDGSVPYTDVDLTGSVALVLGSEAHGLTAEWSGRNVVGVRLPMRGRADSLNVAAAAAVLFYEARRQRDARA